MMVSLLMINDFMSSSRCMIVTINGHIIMKSHSPCRSYFFDPSDPFG